MATHATALAALLAKASIDFTPIVGQPTDNDIFNITKALYPLLHNAKYDKLVVAGVNNHNIIGLLQLAATYAAARGEAFPRPLNPGPYDLTIPDNATSVVRNRMEAAHNTLVSDFNVYEAAEDGIKLFIQDNINETWIKALRDPLTFYNNVTAYDMLEFLRRNSGGLHNVDVATLPSAMLHYYANNDSIPEFILELEYSREKLARALAPMSDATLLATAHSQVMASLHYPEATREWELLPPAAKTGVAWQAHYRAANIARNRLLKANPLAFGAANHVTDANLDTAAITLALDNIANAATNDSNVISTLMARVKALETQARRATVPPAIPQATPTAVPGPAPTRPTPYVPRIYTLAEALATFDVNNYCWTHGWRVHTNHTSASCKKKRRGHNKEATRADTKGGSNKNQGWETNPNPM
jgi:hypothetical protein